MGAPQTAGQQSSGVTREEEGRTAFEYLLERWLRRSDWSLHVACDLAEQAITQLDARNIPLARKSSYRPGEMVVYESHVWRARRGADLEGLKAIAMKRPPRASDPNDPWEGLVNLRRVHPSQLNLIIRGRSTVVGTQVFDALGSLNEYLADIRAGRTQPPTEPRLRQKALQGLIIEDSDGVFGPEEFLGVYLGRLRPPLEVSALTKQEAAKVSSDLARQIRAGMVAAGLDLVDGWSYFVAAYPSSDRDRLARLRDVAFGRTQWSPEQVEDEQMAVAIALKKLSQREPAKQPPAG